MREDRFDVVLCEGPADTGLSPDTIRAMLSEFTKEADLFPVDIVDDNGQTQAVGFINGEAYEALDYDIEPLRYYITDILEDADKETDDGVYKTKLKSVYSASAPDVSVRILMRYGYR